MQAQVRRIAGELGDDEPMAVGKSRYRMIMEAKGWTFIAHQCFT
jgi:hypothetical protein